MHGRLTVAAPRLWFADSREEAMRRSLLILAVGVLQLAICIHGSADSGVERQQSAAPPPEASWPAGEEWPAGLLADRVAASDFLLSGVDDLTAGGRSAFRRICEASRRLNRMPHSPR